MRSIRDKDDFDTAKCMNGPQCETQIPYRTFEDIPIEFEKSRKQKTKKYIHTKDLQNMCNYFGLTDCKECKNNRFLQNILDDDIVKFTVALLIILLLYKRIFNT